MIGEKQNHVIHILAGARKSGIFIFLEGTKLRMKAPKDHPVAPGLMEELKANREAIIAFLQSEEGDMLKINTVMEPVIPAFPLPGERLPLSFAQERLWFIDQLEGSTHYHMPAILKLQGQPDLQLLEQACREIVGRHEVLRTVLQQEDGKPFQVILPPDGWKMEYVEDPALADGNYLQQYIDHYINRPFDLSAEYMLRVSILRLKEDEYVLLALMHHVASDAWSQGLVVKELAELYNARLQGRTPVLPELPVQYKDYALWQRRYLQEHLLDDQLAYWEKQLKNVLPLNLPTDFAHPAKQSTRGRSVVFPLDAGLSARLQQLSNQQEVTLFMTMLAAFKVLLYRYSGQEDICVGTSVANRTQQELTDLVGFFVNTLALRSQLNDDITFAALLQEVKNTTLEAYANQDIPFLKVVEKIGAERDISRSPVFQVMFVLQNTPGVPDMQLGDLQLSTTPVEYAGLKFNLTFNIFEAEGRLLVNVDYSTDLFEAATINAMMRHYETLLQAVTATPEVPVGRLDMLSADEKHLLLHTYSGTQAAYPEDQTIVSLFEAQAQRTPDQTALIYKEQRFTYRELNAEADKLAVYLRTTAGVKPNHIVALLMEQSDQAIIGILGILKAGGAYLPLDPLLPAERLTAMLKDAAPQALVTSSSWMFSLNEYFTEHIFAMDIQLPMLEAVETPPQVNQPDDLAYVIYTSGSTGQPKGVMISHRSNVNMSTDQVKKFGVQANDHVLQFASLSFDASVSEICMAFYTGAALVIADKELISDGGRFIAYLRTNNVSVATLPPAYLGALKAEELRFLRVVITAGEAAVKADALYLAQHLSYFNAYGPTECAVCVSMHKVTAKDKQLRSIPIGTPVANLRVYILNNSLELCPPGAYGEICVSGIGLAKGYLNSPALSATRFIDNPFEPGEKIYRTGDIGRWLPDGAIAFLGRKDEQVKIRGYRIELGEIENRLQQAPGVLQSVVTVYDDKQGLKRLVGFVVPDADYKESAVLQQLEQLLPDYMIPSALLVLEALPLTANGKVDRRQLPDPAAILQKGDNYEAPRTEVEKILCTIWQELLHAERVGIHDNFFSLGGDSIITIQVVSRCKRAGLELQPRDLFEYQTVAGLAQQVRTISAVQVEQGLLEGEVALMPVQQWYLQQQQPAISHYNQSVLLSLDKKLPAAVVEEVLHKLTAHHDSLRLHFTATTEGWEQAYGINAGTVETVMLGDNEDLTSLCNRYQRNLDIANGVVYRFVHILTPASYTHNRLLLVVHHLCVDGISWRIIAEDLETGLEQVMGGGTPDFGSKSSSYRQWSSFLGTYSTQPSIQREQQYWRGVTARYRPLPVDHTAAVSTQNDVRTVVVNLDAAATTTLLQGAHTAYHTEINDLLLSALLQTICSWSGHTDLLLGMEGHGREPLTAELDNSRTVGWFTSFYPLCLSLPAAGDKGMLLRSVKEQLRNIPGKGIGYGLLRYLHPDHAVRSSLAAGTPEVVFNYLGQLDNTIRSGQYVSWAPEPAGMAMAAEHIFSSRLEINSSVMDGELMLAWNYSSKDYDAATIEMLAADYIRSLQELITHCTAVKQRVFTPSDYGLGNRVTLQEFDTFMRSLAADSAPVTAIYPLGPLQEGLLFHGVYEQSEAYMAQFTCEFAAPDLDLLRRCWEQLMQEHSVLRSSYHHKDMSIPVQCVHEKVALPFEVIDYRQFSKDEQRNQLEAFLVADRLRGFDFRRAPLMRVTLFRLEADVYRMVWTSHHIILDGWSTAILMEEILQHYEVLSKGGTLQVKQEDRYEDYIRYLGKRDAEADAAFWKEYMRGFTQPVLLPFVNDQQGRNKGTDLFHRTELVCDAAFTARVKAFAQANQLTVNTLMQGVWSYLLYRYTGLTDVLYGVTVSGRPGELENAEQRVGLYINTLPLRAQVNVNDTVTSWLTELQAAHTRTRESQYTPLHTIQSWAGIRGDLFDNILAFENYPVSEKITADWELNAFNVSIQEQSNYLLALNILLKEELVVCFTYNQHLLDARYAAMMKTHFGYILEQMVENGSRTLGSLQLLTPAETLQLAAFNDTAAAYPSDKSLVTLFEEQAARTPGNPAVVTPTGTLNYRQLNENADQLAAYLVDRYTTDRPVVALMMQRSEWLITGMLGILKSGAAYLPVDPSLVPERKSWMLEDAGATILVTDSDTMFELDVAFSGEIIALDIQLPTLQANKHLLPEVIDAAAPAYVIYTSGSTGQPKGVQVAHQAIVNLSCWHNNAFEVSDTSRATVYSGIGFDACGWEIWPYLLKGACLYPLEEAVKLNMEQLVSRMRNSGITHCFLPTPVCEQFIAYAGDLDGRLLLLTGGDKLKTAGAGLRVVNNYGLTETGVVATSLALKDYSVITDPAPIGRPIANTAVYILDAQLQQQPLGVKGELYIGGDLLANGYLNTPELTASRFIDHPFIPGAKLYRTGDVGCWLPDGCISFQGRGDEQVKIRGYRIELGDVESHLQQAPGVLQCVVTANEDAYGNKRLIGYVLPAADYREESVQHYLQQRLPEYMRPAALVVMEAFPLTANGKIDRKQLPDPGAALQRSDSYAAPRNATEKTLCRIWEELLHVEQVGIHDNFFSLGGDSIITIQVVSRSKRAGLELQPKDIFECQTIARLSEQVRSLSAVQAEQGLLDGAVKLLPIQKWYLDQERPQPSHYNQSVLLSLNKALPAAGVEQVLHKLAAHHDSLRLHFTQTAAGWEQYYGANAGTVETIELGDGEDLTALCDRYQRSLDITKGIVYHFVYMRTPAAYSHNRLLMVIHHLCVDGISWRILVEDLETGLEQVSAGQLPDFGGKSSSFRQWSAFLAAAGTRLQVLCQQRYWEGVISNYAPLPVDHAAATSAIRDVRMAVASLDTAATAALLQDASAAYHTEINDLLLSALLQTICNWSGHTNLLLGLEGHGREQMTDELDCSRTIGWFTNLYPVNLALPAAGDMGLLVRSVKEQLRSIPGKGMGYGMLRYLHPDEAVRNSLASRPPEVVFNYLGQLDNTMQEGRNVSWAPEPAGVTTSEDHPFTNRLQVNGSVMDGVLTFAWNYSAKDYDAATIETLAATYMQVLQELIRHCTAIKKRVYTPSDYGLGGQVTLQEFDAFVQSAAASEAPVTGIYPLGPLQEGLLFHGVYEQYGAYIEQFSCDFKDIDITVLRRCWEQLLQDHSILRSSYHHKDMSIPVQCVHEWATLPFEIIDIRAYNDDEKRAQLESFLEADRLRGFDFHCAPLMRITLFRLDEDVYRMVWTSHHIILDGWSTAILMEEILQSYETLFSGGARLDRIEDRYEDYIRYLGKRDKLQEQAFWKDYLAGFTQPSLLPFTREKQGRNKGDGTFARIALEFDEDYTTRVRNFAQANSLTVNTLMQGVWSYLLHQYTGLADVLYGVTVSGRPGDMENAEQRVGLYINTLPLRSEMQPSDKVMEWLNALQAGHTATRENQYTPLHTIQSRTGIRGDLFDSILVFENYPMGEVLSREWKLQAFNTQMKEQTNYLLTINIFFGATAVAHFTYNERLVPAACIHMIRGQFRHVLSQLMDAGVKQVQDIRLLCEQDIALLNTFSKREAAYPAGEGIIAIFNEQVAARPDEWALTDSHVRYTYQQLDERSTALAQHLLDKGTGSEEMIAVCADRSAGLIVALLAILKAGAAYVTIDRSWPPERVKHILDDTGARLLLVEHETKNVLPAGSLVETVNIGALKYAPVSTQTLPAPAGAAQLAYVMYTSGSTGKPKGVLVTQGNVVSLVKGTSFAALKAGDVLLATGAPTFDAVTFEYWGMLLNGGCLVMCSEKVLLDKDALKQQIKAAGVNKMWFTAGWFNQLVDVDLTVFAPLQLVVAGGEKLSALHVRKLKEAYPAITIVNGYGPTENTTFSLTHLIEDTSVESVPIGKPLENRSAYILNSRMEFCPIGVAGELYVGGAGLSRGYLQQEELTAARFVTIITPAGTPEKVYRTGDVAMWQPDGTMLFLGRTDNQLKIRGYRVEPDEITNVLVQCPSVKQGVATSFYNAANELQLVAYIVPADTFDRKEIIAYLSAQLPDYMLPSLLLPLPELPLTANGKVDLRALPHPDTLKVTIEKDNLPRNKMEDRLAVIWKEVLGTAHIGRDDNFFEAGGHSLKAISMMTMIEKEFNVNVNIADVFDYPTIRELTPVIAAAAYNEHHEIPLLPEAGSYLLSHAQKRLWINYQLEENKAAYNIPMVYVLEGDLSITALRKALEAMVARHESLRTVFITEEGEPRQRIDPPGNAPVMRFLDLRTAADREQQAAAVINQEADTLFILSTGPLLRTTLLQVEDERFIFCLTMHHIVSDILSMEVMARELSVLYEAYRNNEMHSLAPLALQYKDYASWQHQLIADNNNRHAAYWQQQLGNELPLLQLPFDFQRPAIKSYKGDVVGAALDAAVVQRLQAIGKEHQVSMFMTLLTCVKILLHHYSGQEDIIVGTPVAGREHAALKDQIGFYVNMLALRTHTGSQDTFVQLLKKIREVTLQAYEHQVYPFDKLVSELSLNRVKGRAPLFDVRVELNDITDIRADFKDVNIIATAPTLYLSHYDLTFTFVLTNEGITCQVIYATDLFKKETATRLLSDLLSVIEQVTANPGIGLSAVQLQGKESNTETMLATSFEFQ